MVKAAADQSAPQPLSARARRLPTVPAGQPRRRAVSAWERPRRWKSTSGARYFSGSRPISSSSTRRSSSWFRAGGVPRGSRGAAPWRPAPGLGDGLPGPGAAPLVWRPCKARFPAGRHRRWLPPSAPGSRTWPGRRLRHPEVTQNPPADPQNHRPVQRRIASNATSSPHRTNRSSHCFVDAPLASSPEERLHLPHNKPPLSDRHESLPLLGRFVSVRSSVRAGREAGHSHFFLTGTGNRPVSPSRSTESVQVLPGA